MPRSDALRALLAEMREYERGANWPKPWKECADKLTAIILAAPDPAPAVATVKESLTVEQPDHVFVVVDACDVPIQVLGPKRGVEAELGCRTWDEQRAPAYRPHRVVRYTAALTPPATPTDRIVVDQATTAERQRIETIIKAQLANEAGFRKQGIKAAGSRSAALATALENIRKNHVPENVHLKRQK